MKNESFPMMEIDAGKLLHNFNIGAKSQLAIFEERVKLLGESISAKWRLASLDSHHLYIEDTEKHKFYRANIQRLGQGKIKISNITELKIVESKKENSFKKNIRDIVEAIGSDNLKEADGIFTRISKQKFRASVIPEHGCVTTRDGDTRYIPVNRDIVSKPDQKSVIKAVCEALTSNIKVSKGRVVEATFNNKTIQIPVSELTARRVVANEMREFAQKAYLSEGFSNLVKDAAILVSEGTDASIDKAVELVAEFLMENQEFSLLNQAQMQELIGNTLATQGCFNKYLGEDVGSLFYKVNCKANKDQIVEAWREVARTTEYAPFVENVRSLAESTNFNEDYENFLEVLFEENAGDLKARSAAYLTLLRNIRDILHESQEYADEAKQVSSYITKLEQAGSGDELDNATMMEIDKFVSGLREEVISAAADLSAFSTINTFDQSAEPSQADPKKFGDEDLGSELGGGGGAGLDIGGEDLGAELPGAEAGKEEEAPEATLDIGAELGLGGEEGEAAPAAEPELLAADVKRDATPLNESEVRKAINTLDSSNLKLELVEWKKNASAYFKNDGQDNCVMQLKAYVDRAKTLGEHALADQFGKVLLENIPVELPDEIEEQDPYSYKKVTGKLDSSYKTKLAEDHAEWPNKMKQSKEGGQIGEKESAKGDAMGCAGEAEMNVMSDAGHKENILSKSSTAMEGKIKCMECNSSHEMADCLTEDGALCPSCGADVYSYLLEALEISENLKGEGHKMKSLGGSGVQSKKVGKVDIGGSGKKEKMDGQEGKGVTGKSVKKSDGTGDGGKKDKMEQPGSGVAEAQLHSATSKYGKLGLKKNKMIAKEGKLDESTVFVTDGERSATLQSNKPVDDIVAAIASSMGGDELDADMAGDLAEPGEVTDVGMGGEVGGELGSEVGAEDLPPVGDMGGEEMPPEIGAETEAPMGMEPEGGEGGEGGLEGIEAEEGAEAGEGEEEGGMPDFGDGEEGEDEDENDEEEEGDEEDEEEGGEVVEDTCKCDCSDKCADDCKCACHHEVKEGKLPDHLKQFQFKKKAAAAAVEKKDEGEKKGPPAEKAEDKKEMAEDNDVTTPTSKEYTSSEVARKDGDGKMMRPKPKFSETDKSGGKFKTARPY